MNYVPLAQSGWLKAELHSHCNLDPADHRLCRYSAQELIRECARLGYQVLAVTCHNLDVWTSRLHEFAADYGITLIPGMEVATEGKRHILVYNFRTGAENLDTLDKIRRHSRSDTLVVAPHPYFPSPSCLGRYVDRNSDVFDAIEISGFRAPGLDFNRRAREVAAAYGKPMIGNSDVHQLWQLGRTFTWIQAEPALDSILSAVKRGKVRVESQALSYAEVIRWWTTAVGSRIVPHPDSAADRGHVVLPAHPSEGRSGGIIRQ